MAQDTLKLVQEYARKKGYDNVELFSHLDGVPVYEMIKSSYRPKGKFGYPPLCSINKSGNVFQLDDSQVHDAIILLNR